jgi:hypothetical protein
MLFRHTTACGIEEALHIANIRNPGRNPCPLTIVPPAPTNSHFSGPGRRVTFNPKNSVQVCFGKYSYLYIKREEIICISEIKAMKKTDFFSLMHLVCIFLITISGYSQKIPEKTDQKTELQMEFVNEFNVSNMFPLDEEHMYLSLHEPYIFSVRQDSLFLGNTVWDIGSTVIEKFDFKKPDGHVDESSRSWIYPYEFIETFGDTDPGLIVPNSKSKKIQNLFEISGLAISDKLVLTESWFFEPINEQSHFGLMSDGKEMMFVFGKTNHADSAWSLLDSIRCEAFRFASQASTYFCSFRQNRFFVFTTCCNIVSYIYDTFEKNGYCIPMGSTACIGEDGLIYYYSLVSQEIFVYDLSMNLQSKFCVQSHEKFQPEVSFNPSTLSYSFVDRSFYLGYFETKSEKFSLFRIVLN